MNVLITSAGSNTAISVIKALKMIDQSIIIHGSDTNPPHLCSGYKWVDRFHILPTAKVKDTYVDALTDILINNKVDCLIPIHDMEIETISGALDHFSNYAFIATNPVEIVRTCNNKRVSNYLAMEAGLQVPQEFLKNDSFKWPVICKPINGVSSAGINIFTNEKVLRDQLKEMDSNLFVLQEFIEGTEYTVDVYNSYRSNFFGGVVRRRIETKAGISTKGVTVRNDKLLAECQVLINKLNYKGAANIQFIERLGEYYFIEINPRFSGAGILTYEAGFNSPWYTVLEAGSKPLPL